MPLKSYTFCKWPGCNKLTREGYCEDHKPLREQQIAESNQRYSKQRGSAASQGYDYRWQKVRESYLKQYPLCERCEERGKITVATIVHHKQAIKDGGARLDFNNLQALCNACHEIYHKHERWGKSKNKHKK